MEESKNYIYNMEDNPRILIIPEGERSIGVANDHKSTVKMFRILRYAEDGTDLMTVTDKKINYINLAAKTDGAGKYQITDAEVSSVDGNYITFSWSISRHVVMAAGMVAFILCFRNIEDGNITYEWNTEYNDELTVARGLETGDTIAAEIYPDILQQWLDKMKNYDTGITGINDGITSGDTTWSSEKIARQAVMKQEERAVSMLMLTDDVKAAMTGGSAAYVGYGSVGYNNLDNKLQNMIGSDVAVEHTVMADRACYGSVGGSIATTEVTAGKVISANIMEGDRYILSEDVTSLYAISSDNKILAVIEDADPAYRIAPAGTVQIMANVSNNTYVTVRKMSPAPIQESQLSRELQAKLSLISLDKSPNLINPDEIVKSYALGTDGSEKKASTENVSARHNITGYIAVQPEDDVKISAKGKSYTADRICTYDSDKTFVRVVDKVNSITIEDGEAYIRVDFYNSNIATVENYVRDNYQVEVGSVTALRPYGEMLPYIVNSVSTLEGGFLVDCGGADITVPEDETTGEEATPDEIVEE